MKTMRFIRILGISIKTGRVTVKYPAEQPFTTSEYRGRIEIDPLKCVGCGACAVICPPKALVVDRENGYAVLRYFIGRCIFCAMCADVCPQKAIRVTNSFELATTDIHDLYVDLEHELTKCDICGEFYIPKKLLESVTKAISVENDRLSLCPTCRRRESVRRIASRIVGVGR